MDTRTQFFKAVAEYDDEAVVDMLGAVERKDLKVALIGATSAPHPDL